MPAGPDSHPSHKPPLRRRRLGRPIWRISALLFLAVLLFHRPILLSGIEQALRHAAKKDGLSLQIRLSGNVFSNLSLEAVDLRPLSSPHPTVTAIQVQKATIQYNLLRLFWSGPGECINSYSIDGATLRLKASVTRSTGTRSFAELIEDILAQPALYADAVHITNLNLEIEGSQTLRSILGASLSARPDHPGSLSITSIALANGAVFQNWNAATSYNQRNLLVTGLKLHPDLELSSLSFDASERSLGKSRIALRLQYRGGWASGSVFSQKAKGTSDSDVKLEFSAADFPIEEITQFLGWQALPFSKFQWAQAHLRGTPKKPASWKGQADIRTITPLPTPTEPLVTEIHAAFQSGAFHLENLEAYSGTSTAFATGEVKLPPSISELSQLTGHLQVRADVEDLADWGSLMQPVPFNGSAHISGTLAIGGGTAQLSLQGNAETPGSTPVQFTQGTALLALRANVANILDPKQFHGRLELSLEAPSIYAPQGSATFEKITASASIDLGRVLVEKLTLTQNSNRIIATGEIPFASRQTPLRLEIQASCPSLETTGLTLRGHPVAGEIQGTVSAQITNGHLGGSARLSAGPLNWGGFDLGEFKSNISLSEGTLAVEDLLLRWDKDEWAQMSGSTEIAPPHTYALKVEAHVASLQRFEPLFRQSGIDTAIRGQIAGDWTGQGTIQPLSGTGRWNLSIKNAHFKSLDLKEVLCSGTYAPGQLKAAPIRIATPHTRLDTQIAWSDDTLKVQQISLEQWGYPTLSGFLVLPIGWSKNGAHWNENSSLSGELTANRLDLVTLFTAAGLPTPVAGSVKFTASLGGTPAAPTALFNLAARELRSPSHPNLGSGEIDLSGHYSSGAFVSDVTLRSTLQSPARVHVRIPVALGDLLLAKTDPSQIPVQARLELHKASLKSLPSLLWPGFKKVDGSFSMDADIGGTLLKPTWRGSCTLDAPVIHFVSYRFPAITELQAAIDFDEHELRLRKLRADLGGGTLTVNGSAHLHGNDNATLDFHAVGHEILIVRSRDLLLRLNGDVHLRGPWNQATISGKASSTKSRVTRDIDLLPVNVLKKSAMAIPVSASGPGKPWFTFQRSPFSEWKFDVSLRTTPEDPFLIRGNRLHGSAQADIKLKGTGAAPTLEGNYKTTDLVAYLPFARIQIFRGHFWYSPNKPFIPILDFTAETEVRNHRIRMYLTGSQETPRINLNSDPPLNETDLLTLLTTGILPGDTSENGQALAGRAAAVLFQELSGKVFESKDNKDRLSALRRFSLDVGALNSRTGHQETKLTYRMNDNFFMIGELGANGDFGGQIKYLLRFR